ncbi:hypothetical protein UlMin_011810 [Ulmus minor]
MKSQILSRSKSRCLRCDSSLSFSGTPRLSSSDRSPSSSASFSSSLSWRKDIIYRKDFSSKTQKQELVEQQVPEEVRSEHNNSNTVPWIAETIMQGMKSLLVMQVMLLWVAAFWFIGSWMVPFAGHVAGFSQESLTFRGQALFSLVTDVTEGLARIMILHRCLSWFRPLPPDWFKFSLKGNWHFDVALGCLMFPLVNQLSQFNLNLLPLLPSTPVTLPSVEQSILACDPIEMALYAIIVSVCAPLRCMLVPFILG